MHPTPCPLLAPLNADLLKAIRLVILGCALVFGLHETSAATFKELDAALETAWDVSADGSKIVGMKGGVVSVPPLGGYPQGYVPPDPPQAYL